MTKLTKEQITEIKNNADETFEYSKDMFLYLKDGKNTLIQDGEILVENVDKLWWYEKDVFEYQKNWKKTLIKDGKILIQDADCIFWYDKDVFEYAKDGKEYRINLNEEVKKEKWYKNKWFNWFKKKLI